jgi:putative ABC transport system permease protein
MQSVRIAFRNIARQKKRTLLLGGAIAFGILVITLIGSFTTGIQTSVTENFTGIFGGHIYVKGQELSPSGKFLNRIGDRETLEEALSVIKEDIKDLHKRSRAMGEVIFGNRQEVISIEGVEWKSEDSLWADLGVDQGQSGSLSDEAAIILPDSIAESLDVKIGESVIFRTSTITGQTNVGEFTVAGIYPENSGFGITSAYAGLPFVNNIIGLGKEEYQHLNITVAETDKIDRTADILYRELGLLGEVENREDAGSFGPQRMFSMFVSSGALAEEEERWRGTRFSVSTINDLMDPILALVQVLKYIGVGLFLVILGITMAGLLNTFRMVLIERTREIGTMRAVGMQRSGVRNMFLLEALFLAIFGTACGLASAFILMGILGSVPLGVRNAFQFFTIGGTFAFPVVFGDITGTVLIIAGITILSALLPARRAANLRPADSLRANY